MLHTLVLPSQPWAVASSEALSESTLACCNQGGDCAFCNLGGNSLASLAGAF